MECTRLHFSAIDSTNTLAKRNPHLFDANELGLVTADKQYEGRGQFKREWLTPPGLNVSATLCFFVPKDQKDLQTIGQIMGVIAAKAIETFGIQPKLKWPNDLLFREKKIGGILCETQTVDELIFIAAGIGINVNVPEEILQQIDQPAISMGLAAGREIEVEAVILALQKQTAQDIPLFIKSGFEPFYADYTSRLK